MFINFWYAVEWAEDVTDSPLRVRMLGQDFVVFRDADGTVRCLSNTCVHRGGSLAGGKVVGRLHPVPLSRLDFPTLTGSAPRYRHSVRTHAYPAARGSTRIPRRSVTALSLPFSATCRRTPRPPIMEIPEYGRDGWRATCEKREAQHDYRRHLENSLDPAHNEFVHPTHGFSGARDDYYVPEIDVDEDTEWRQRIPDHLLRAARSRTRR